jgi:predicted N-formylglutamate amidohydrolase
VDVRVARVVFLVTCEHGGNEIPREFARLFRGRGRLLDSHRGYDRGALATARDLARALRAPLIASTVSRLLVELNRSPGRHFRSSPVMRNAPAELRERICRRYYVPYRQKVESFVSRARDAGLRVIHVSSHTFTPVLRGNVRRADVGLLYDPRRRGERLLCERWRRSLRARRPGWIVRRNYPYLGRSDGLTSYLRRRFDDRHYLGIELEVNQKHVAGNALPAPDRAAIIDALREALALPITRRAGTG